MGLCIGLCSCVPKFALGVEIDTGLGLFLFDCIEFEAGLLSTSRFGLGLGVGGAILEAGLFIGIENGLPGELMFWLWMFCMFLTLFRLLIAFKDAFTLFRVCAELRTEFIFWVNCLCGWKVVMCEAFDVVMWLIVELGSLESGMCCIPEFGRCECIVPAFVKCVMFDAWVMFELQRVGTLDTCVNTLELGMWVTPELEIWAIEDTLEFEVKCETFELGICVIFELTIWGARLCILWIVWNGKLLELLELMLLGVKPLFKAFRVWLSPWLMLVVVKFVLILGFNVLRLETLELTLLKFEFREFRLELTFWFKPVSPWFIPESPDIPEFTLFKSCPRPVSPELILFEPKFWFIVFKLFKFGFIVVRPGLIPDKPKFRSGFDVVIALEVREVNDVFNNDSGSPMLRPTPNVGVAGGRPIPVPEWLRPPWFNWFNWFRYTMWFPWVADPLFWSCDWKRYNIIHLIKTKIIQQLLTLLDDCCRANVSGWPVGLCACNCCSCCNCEVISGREL